MRIARFQLSSIVIASALVIVSPASAQEEGVPLDVAFSLGFFKPLNADCTMADQDFVVELANCSPVDWSIDGEFAAHVTDHIAPFIRTSWGTSSLNTTADVHDQFLGSFSFPVEADASGVTVTDLCYRGVRHARASVVPKTSVAAYSVWSGLGVTARRPARHPQSLAW